MVESQPSLSEHSFQLAEHRLAGEHTPEYILLRIGKALVATASKLSMEGSIVLTPIYSISEYTIGFIYLLKFRLGCLLITRIGVRVVLEGQFPVGTLYILLAGMLGNAQDLIVILHNHPFT